VASNSQIKQKQWDLQKCMKALSGFSVRTLGTQHFQMTIKIRDTTGGGITGSSEQRGMPPSILFPSLSHNQAGVRTSEQGTKEQ
jgi:hypothetical protein